MSLDLSTKPNLRGLARLAADLQAVAAPLGVEFFLMGAAARDLMLLYAHGIDTRRATKDADFAVMVAIAEHPDLFEAEDFDYAEAGVRLLARDVARLLARNSVERLLNILVPEADEAGGFLLAEQSGRDVDSARRLIEVLCNELATTKNL